MARCDVCKILPVYYRLDDGRGYCTQAHAKSALGDSVKVVVHPEVNGQRRLELIVPQLPTQSPAQQWWANCFPQWKRGQT